MCRNEQLNCPLTSQNVVLIILVGTRANVDQTCQTIVADKLVNQIFVVLENEKEKSLVVDILEYMLTCVIDVLERFASKKTKLGGVRVPMS